MNKIVRVIIAGGRDFSDHPALCKYCDYMLQGCSSVVIVSGGARGADALGERYAKERGHTVVSFPADWTNIAGKPAHSIGTRKDGTKYWKGAGNARNKQMGEYAGHLLAFWDGKSRGTKDMITIANRMGLHTAIYRTDQKRGSQVSSYPR